jgi:hypothetical protein
MADMRSDVSRIGIHTFSFIFCLLVIFSIAFGAVLLPDWLRPLGTFKHVRDSHGVAVSSGVFLALVGWRMRLRGPAERLSGTLLLYYGLCLFGWRFVEPLRDWVRAVLGPRLFLPNVASQTGLAFGLEGLWPVLAPMTVAAVWLWRDTSLQHVFGWTAVTAYAVSLVLMFVTGENLSALNPRADSHVVRFAPYARVPIPLPIVGAAVMLLVLEFVRAQRRWRLRGVETLGSDRSAPEDKGTSRPSGSDLGPPF